MSSALRASLLVLLLAALACDDEGPGARDAAVDALPEPDAAVIPSNDDAGGPRVIDFTATGCDLLDQSAADGGVGTDLRCTGRAPLVLSFVPISTSALGQVLWDFGDGTAKSYELTPRHTYARPGSYDVTLVGGSANGAVSRLRTGFALVTANELGRSCDDAAQCTPGLACVCGAAVPCSPSFARGVCTTSCRDVACPGTSVCADLSLAGMATSLEPWRAQLCVQPCTRDDECATGSCRTLPGRSAPGAPLTWIRGCFADAPASVGEECRGSDGNLHPETCVAGRCLDAGAYGLCSPDCRDTPCPEGFVCALFPKRGEAACLRPCAGAMACSDDPLLACQPAGGAGPRGFVAADLAPGGQLCAPKPCTTDGECAPAGRCSIADGAGNCVAR